MIVLGIDVGFGFTKATNGKEFIIFKSLIGDSTDIQFYSGFGDASLAHNLHVTIGDKSYFVGDFAEQQSNVRQFTLEQDKLMADFVRVLALTAAGTYAEDGMTFNIVSGLPVGYLKNDFQKFTGKLSGTHNVVFHLPDGTKKTKSFTVGSVQMMPQPLGSVFNQLMDDKGQIMNADIPKQKIGVVDIGFRTTDVTIFDHMQYVERGSSTLDTGISKCFSVISDKLRKESGVGVEVFRLYKAVSSGLIRIKGKEYNISGLRDKVYSHFAGVLANDINRLWAEDWDIDTVLLTGGGSAELAKYLQPLVPGQVVPVTNDIDPRLNNVQGYWKYGINRWVKPPVQPKPGAGGDAIPAAPESPEEEDRQKGKWLKKGNSSS